ncbi:MAG: 6,7-dimethyl-8-ribityllumazine synthase [Parvicellaceae bacterium]|jgi:6,7-dimethyl-8-ribityllumazine synthase
MATAGNNLSEYNKELIPNASEMKFGIVVSEWNDKITDGLLEGATSTLLEHGCNKDNFLIEYVPGTFELALGAQLLFESMEIDAVICIGSVIQGETKHFDFVCEGATLGIKDVGLKYNKPAIFCVLTDMNESQAIERSGGKHGNKGTEAAVSAIKMVALKQRLFPKRDSMGFGHGE